MTLDAGRLRRSMTLGEILRGALALYRRHFRALLIISVTALPFSIVSQLGFILSAGNRLLVNCLVLLGQVVEIIFIAVLATAVAHVADHNEIAVGSAFAHVLRRLGALFLAVVRVLGIVFILAVTIVGIPFAIFLGVRWAFFTQAVVLEDASSGEAQSYSREIVQGHWWRVFGILLLLWVLGVAVTSPATTITWTVSRPIGAILANLIGVIFLPFAAIAYTLLFFDLQSREREHVSIA